MNSQGELFEKNYEDLLDIVMQFVELSSTGSVSESDMHRIIGALGDIYTQAYTEEIEYILELLGLDFNETERAVIRNKVGTSKFVRDNYTRLAEILNNRADDIKNKTEKSNDPENLNRVLRNIAELITLSELQMAIETASVFGSTVIQDILDTKLTKTWNSVLDSNTCVICRSMHGTTIPVEESFLNTQVGSEYSEYLSYSGGEGAYAHPRCRCWLTYEKA